MASSRPRSPSLRRREQEPRPEAFCDNDAIETLLADAVVGNYRYAKVMMVYRQCSKRMSAAVDQSVDRWCLTFSRKQAEHLTFKEKHSRANPGEDAYRMMVELEGMVRRAFGSVKGPLKCFIDLSKVDRFTYYAAVLHRCVLCGCRLSPTINSEPDADSRGGMPDYTLAHASCQRKHMVLVGSNASRAPRTAEQKDLHRELAAVSAFVSQAADVSRTSLLPVMSRWYRNNVDCMRFRGSIWVWLRPHERVRADDTLYGALDITEEDVKVAVRKNDELSIVLRKQDEQRRISIASKTKELTALYKAEVRVWLGKGKTRWRCIEDLELFHEDMLSSTQLDRVVDPSKRQENKTKSVASVCNCIHLFSKSMDAMAVQASKATVDWAVRHATIQGIFGNAGYELQFVDKDKLDLAVANEAKVYAKALDLVQSLGPDSASCYRVRAMAAGHGGSYDSISYDIYTRINWSECCFITQTSACFSHVDLCKLKYILASHMPSHLHSGLPEVFDVPLSSVGWQGETDRRESEDQVASYMNAIIRVASGSVTGLAKSVLLKHLIGVELFYEIVDTCRYIHNAEANVSDTEGEEGGGEEGEG